MATNNDGKAIVIQCPQCSSTDIEIISEDHAKCSYCGATLLLPKNKEKEAKKNGGTILGVLEDALENINETLQNAAKSNPQRSDAPIINTDDAKYVGKKLFIILCSIFVMIVVICAIALPILFAPDDSPEPDYPDSSLGNTPTTGCPHSYFNDCDSTCNRCGETRTVVGHIFDNDCDGDCNICGFINDRNHHTDNDNDGVCDSCQDPYVLKYFTFSLNSDGESYTLTSVSSDFKGTLSLSGFWKVSIPSTHQGKPVTAIGSDVFTNRGDMVDLTIPSSITTIHANAFANTSLEKITLEEKSDWYLVEAGKWLSDITDWMANPDPLNKLFLYGHYTWTKTNN